MLLNNIIVFHGEYQDIRLIRNDLLTFIKKKKNAKIYHNKTTKYMKKLKIISEEKYGYFYELKVSFLYSKNNIDELIKDLTFPNVTTAHLCYSEKKRIWIVNDDDYIIKFKLIPPFALTNILLDYMHYKESAIITDSFENIKYDRNTNKIVVNDKQLPHKEIIDIIFNKTIKGKQIINILEDFIKNYYNRCINKLENIYANTEENTSSEEPSPFALFFVTFGILGIIFILLKIMNYI